MDEAQPCPEEKKADEEGEETQIGRCQWEVLASPEGEIHQPGKDEKDEPSVEKTILRIAGEPSPSREAFSFDGGEAWVEDQERGSSDDGCDDGVDLPGGKQGDIIECRER